MPFVGAPPTAVTAVYEPLVAVHDVVQYSTKYPHTDCPAVVGMRSQLRLTDACPTIARSADTVFAGPADVDADVPVPANVMALTRYMNDAPGVMADVASTQVSMAEQVYPGTAFSA